VVVQKQPGGKACKENTYLFSEVEEALRPLQVTKGALVLNGERRYTFARAKEDLENPSKKRWEEWKDRCDLLCDKDEHGNPIEKPIKIYPEVVGVCPFKTCDADQIDLAKERLSETGTGRFVWHDKPYVSWDVARRHLTHKRQLLVDRMSLLTHHQDLTQKFNFSKEKWYDEEKLLGLKERLIARSRPRPPKVREKKARKKAPIVTFSGIFEEKRPNGEPYKRYTVRAASRMFGIPEPILYKYMKEIPKSTAIDLKRHGFTHEHLPSEDRVIPGTENQCVPTIDERDLELLRKARTLLHAEGKRVAKDGTQKSVRQICALHGINSKQGRILVAKFLRDNLSGTRTVRAHSLEAGTRRNRHIRGCGYTPTTTYSLKRVHGLLNGRDLLDAAREHQAPTRDAMDPSNGQPSPLIAGEQTPGRLTDVKGHISPMPSAASETHPTGSVHKEFSGYPIDLQTIEGRPARQVFGEIISGLALGGPQQQGGQGEPEEAFPFDHFSGAKMRPLLRALWGKGKVAIAKVTRSVYDGDSPESRDALKALQNRTNAKLAVENSNYQVKRSGAILELVPL
jgi:hypothetical protein